MSENKNVNVTEATDKEKFFEDFNNGLHRIGRFTLILSAILLLAIPFVIGLINGVAPELKGFFIVKPFLSRM